MSFGYAELPLWGVFERQKLNGHVLGSPDDLEFERGNIWIFESRLRVGSVCLIGGSESCDRVDFYTMRRVAVCERLNGVLFWELASRGRSAERDGFRI